MKKKILTWNSALISRSRYLFSLPPKYRTNLSFEYGKRVRYSDVNGKDKLKKAFEDNKQSLSNNAHILRINEKNWIIGDITSEKITEYMIKDVGTRLHIWEKVNRLWEKPRVCLRDVATGEEIRSIKPKKPVDSVIWSKNEEELLIWDNHSVELFDMIEGNKILSSEDFEKNQKTSKNTKKVYNGWNEKRGKSKYSFDFYRIMGGVVSGVIWSNDGKRILAWNNKGSAVFFDREKKKSRTFIHYFRINGACWFTDEKEVLTWSKDGTAKVWSIKTGKEISKFMSKIECEGMNISNARGLTKNQYITLLSKGAFMPLNEIKDLNLSLQTHLGIFSIGTH